MSTRSPSRRGRSRLRLKIRSADAVEDFADAPRPPRRTLPPHAIAALTGLTSGIAGWLLVAIVVLIGWLTAPAGDAGAAIRGATQVWLLAHGGGLRIGAVTWTVIPLGLTLVLVFLISRSAVTVRRESPAEPSGASARGQSRTTRPSARDARAVVWARCVTVSFPLAGGYASSVLVGGLIAGTAGQAVRAALGAVVVALLGAAWGLARTGQLPLFALLPDWARGLPKAVITAVWVVLSGGAVALTVSLIRHRQRVTGIAEGLGVDGVSVIPVVLTQLAFLPNLVIWAGSWTLGAGLRLGTDSVVAPAATDVGLVPSIPVLGALPDEGAGRWLLLWLVTGVIAGALAALVVFRHRPADRTEETTAVCGLAGLLAALAYTVLALLSRGALGSDRLRGVGPRLLELLLLGGALLGLSALVVGLLDGWWRLRGRRRADRADDARLTEQVGAGRAGEDRVDP